MKIHLGFNEEWLYKYEARNSSVVFFIAWEHEGHYYPDKTWIDLGELILAMWIGNTQQLLNGSVFANFHFMDGPFELKAKYSRDNGVVELVPQRDDFVWEIPLVELANELLLAAKIVVQELERVGLKRRDSLRKSIEMLEEALAAKK